jgi:hypothetical protein
MTTLRLIDKKVVLTGTMKTDTRAVLEDLARAGLVKVQGSVGKTTDYLVVGERPGASSVQKAQSFGIHILKEIEFLHAIANSITSLPTYVAALQERGFDISYYSNEGDGIVGVFDEDFPARVKHTATALLGYARRSELVAKCISVEPARRQEKGFKLLDPQNPERGWLKSEVSMFVFGRQASIQRWNKRKDEWDKIPASALLTLLERRITDLSVLAVHSSPETESVVAVHVIGGKDRTTGRLVGLVIQRVWT